MRQSPWRKERDDFVRALGSAYLFGIPLLYTMEMWWLGTYTDLWKLILFLAIAFGVNTILAYFTGFKRETTFPISLDQAIDALAVGIVGSTLVLLVLNRIQPGEPLDSTLGKIVIQAIPLSIGASIANSIFVIGASRMGDGDPEFHHNSLVATLNDIGATAAGGIFLGFSIAPTEEVPLLAAGLTLWHQLALIVFTLLLTYAIVFEGTFSAQRVRTSRDLPFQQPLSETVLAYCVSLAVAWVVLYLFNQFDLGDPLQVMLNQVLVLALPVSIGGAAGRLII